MAKFIGAVILIVGAKNLIEHLEQVLIILMDVGQSRIIGSEAAFQEFLDAEGMEKFLYHKEASIRGKLPSVKIYDELLIAFELDFL